jgi:nitroreductase/Pyruvate/2-oxoacid:ferredoxin oxidoreductase delta subunit
MISRTRQVVTVDAARCRRCGLCVERFREYCISELDGLPVIDYRVCNICQKCVAICPSQAILVNNMTPKKISGGVALKSADLLALLARRRSTKIFKDKKISEDTLRAIIEVAKYAPNQNKNIDVMVISDHEILDYIDQQALHFYRRIRQVLFSVKAVASFLIRLSPNLYGIMKKLDYDVGTRRRILKPGTQALVLLVGNRRVPVTEDSAQYLLATMIIFAESLRVGSCLMDSVKMAVNWSAKGRKRLRIPNGLRVLGVLSLGYSDEKIVNIPRGYVPKVQWNCGVDGTVGAQGR